MTIGNKEVILIAAKSLNGVIGRNNSIPWHIKEDLMRFQTLTTGASIIMGSNTLLSIGRPLPKRLNIVLTTRPNRGYSEEIKIASNIDEALDIALKTKTNKDEIYIIGGEQIYKQTINSPIVDSLYITEVKEEHEGDTFFPEIDESIWIEQYRTENVSSNAAATKYDFIEYRKVKSCGYKA